MLSLESDYIQGAHPKILEALVRTNMEALTGYGNDEYSQRAKDRIKALCGKKEAEIYFLIGGTQTNQLIIDTMLMPYQSVVSAETGHINIHEAGAIEACGHKVSTIPAYNGKVNGKDLKKLITDYYEDENAEHMVQPGMLYISNPTEYGTLYSKQELTELSDICHNNNMLLYMDGARLGYGLASYATDLNLEIIAEYCDIFYIGGTKVGALCGEAVVFSGIKMPIHFMSMVKQHGALMAKGRLLGIQFDTLFTDDLYFKISRNAIDLSIKMVEVFEKKAYRFYLKTDTNQQFIILENEQYKNLSKELSMGFWERYDDNHVVVRVATSFATTTDDIDELDRILSRYEASSLTHDGNDNSKITL